MVIVVARRVAYALVWIALTAEMAGECFGGKWETPWTPVSTFIFTPIPGLHFPPWYVAVIATWLAALLQKGAKAGRTKPMLTSIMVSLASIGAMAVWGVARGGDPRQVLWQLHGFLMGFVTGQMLVATCRTTAHFVTLGKVVVAACLYRAAILLVFWFSVGKWLDPQLPTQTTHADTTTFVTGILLMGIYAVERRTLKAVAFAAVASIPVMMSMKYNNRRLAWLSLLVGIAIVYLGLPKGKVRRRINMGLLAAAPILAAYIAIGWGRNEGVFKPVYAISTMFGQHEDTSSETRNIENYNLVMTLRGNPLLGTGWGHEYDEVSVAYSVKEFFEQYRFIPHNSVLGLLAFTGLAGFTGIWQVFPIATYLLSQTHRSSTDPAVRMTTMGGVVMLVVFVLQMWGDMGMGTIPSDVLFGASLALAVRLPMLSGVWAPKPKPTVTPAPAPSPDARVDHENGKDVQHHEHAEADGGAAKPTLGEPVAREEERERERRDDDGE